MPRIASARLRELAKRLRTSYHERDSNFEGDLLEMCQLVEKAAEIEDKRTVDTLADSTAGLLATFEELERRYTSRDPRLIELQEAAQVRGSEFAEGVSAVMTTLQEIANDMSASATRY